MTSMINTARRTLNIWIVLTIIFVFGIFAPSIFGIDGFDGGFAISTFCLFLSITGIVVILMYRGRAKALDGIFHGENILVHWSYSIGQWQDYSEKDYQMEKQGKWQLYRLVMVITVVVTFGFWLFNRDSGMIMIGVFLGLGALLASVIWLTTTYDHWQNTKYQGEVYIACDGACVGRELHLWKGWGASLDGLNYDKPNGLLLIEYSMPSRTGRDSAAVRIPVPPGQEEKARQVMAELAKVAGVASTDI
jgi:hypothetical protein